MLGDNQFTAKGMIVGVTRYNFDDKGTRRRGVNVQFVNEIPRVGDDFLGYEVVKVRFPIEDFDLFERGGVPGVYEIAGTWSRYTAPDGGRSEVTYKGTTARHVGAAALFKETAPVK